MLHSDQQLRYAKYQIHAGITTITSNTSGSVSCPDVCPHESDYHLRGSSVFTFSSTVRKGLRKDRRSIPSNCHCTRYKNTALACINLQRHAYRHSVQRSIQSQTPAAPIKPSTGMLLDRQSRSCSKWASSARLPRSAQIAG